MATINKITIPASFELKGETNKRKILANFSVMDFLPPQEIKIEGEKTKGLTGRITRLIGYIFVPVVNARIEAYKNGILYDYTKTDNDGTYVLYLENGIYDIKIEGQAYFRTIKNYEVTNGIKEYRELIVNGQIKRKIYDTVEFNLFDINTKMPLNDTGKRLINGRIIDQHGKPVEGAEIIVADSDGLRDIAAFVKTDEDGRYSFVLERETYDVIIRSPRHHAKIIRNYTFEQDKGFMYNLVNQYSILKYGGEWLWIFN